jgi:hypothetical protein
MNQRKDKRQPAGEPARGSAGTESPVKHALNAPPLLEQCLFQYKAFQPRKLQNSESKIVPWGTSESLGFQKQLGRRFRTSIVYRFFSLDN